MLLPNRTETRLFVLIFALAGALPALWAVTDSDCVVTQKAVRTQEAVLTQEAILTQDERTGEEQSDGEAEAKETEKPQPQPEFADEAHAASFSEALALFADEKWKDAEKLFKSCQKGESKQVKSDLKLWVDACKAGALLKPVDKAINKSQWKVAWQKLERVRAKYGETPIKERLGDLSAAIEKELFLVLATFEEDAPESEQNAGARPNNAKINEDPKYASQGKRSLAWNPGKIGLTGAGGPGRMFGYLPIAKIDGAKLADYPYLRISMFGTEKDAGRFTLFLDTGDRVNMNPLQTRSYYKHHVMDKPGWHHLRFDLRKDFASYTSPKMEEIETFAIIVIPPMNPKQIYIDDVKLEKK